MIGRGPKALEITGKPSAKIMERTALTAETPCKPGRGENKCQEIKGI